MIPNSSSSLPTRDQTSEVAPSRTIPEAKRRKYVAGQPPNSRTELFASTVTTTQSKYRSLSDLRATDDRNNGSAPNTADESRDGSRTLLIGRQKRKAENLETVSTGSKRLKKLNSPFYTLPPELIEKVIIEEGLTAKDIASWQQTCMEERSRNLTTKTLHAIWRTHAVLHVPDLNEDLELLPHVALTLMRAVVTNPDAAQAALSNGNKLRKLGIHTKAAQRAYAYPFVQALHALRVPLRPQTNILGIGACEAAVANGDWQLVQRLATPVTPIKYGSPEAIFPSIDEANVLHYAAAKGLRDVCQMLSSAERINQLDSRGMTPLHYAAQFDQRSIAQDLLRAGAKENARDSRTNKTPRELAHMIGAIGVRCLLDQRQYGYHGLDNLTSFLLQGVDCLNATNSYGNTALHLAASEGKPSVVEALVRLGADITLRNDEGQTPLAVAIATRGRWGVGGGLSSDLAVSKEDRIRMSSSICSRPAEEVKIAINTRRKRDGRTPLILAQSAEEAALLIKHGANVNIADRGGRTPLHHAIGEVTCGEEEALMRLLLESGARVGAQDKKGRTPFWEATNLASPERMTILLEASDNVQGVAGDKGSLPSAIKEWDEGGGLDDAFFSTIKLLIDSGISVEGTDEDGRTCLHYLTAAIFEDAERQIETLQLVIDAGVDVCATDQDGQTAREYALNKHSEECHEEVAEFLKQQEEKASSFASLV